ncbi:MAG: DEAD/DEAH box helicase, partial [Polyangiaceae bacterium]|nr:DEAD/DEAH box helicase [Polyangiaceae bacterium]
GLRQALLDELLTPSWKRVLDSAEGFLPQGSKQAQEERLVWAVSQQGSKLTVTPKASRLCKNGRWSKPTSIRVTPWAAAQEHHIRALDALVDHPRVVLPGPWHRSCQVRRARAALTVVREAANALQLALRMDGSLFLAASLGEHAVACGRHVVVLREAEGDVLVCEVGERVADLVRACTEHGATFPEESHSALLDAIVRMQPDVDLDLPSSLCVGDMAPDDRPILRLDPIDGEAGEGLKVQLGVRPAAVGAMWAPGQGPLTVFGSSSAGRVRVSRDFDAELRRSRDVLERLGLESEIDRWEFSLQTDRALRLLIAVSEMGDDVVVEWPENAARWKLTRTSELRVRVSRMQDWFGVDGEADADGDALSLAALLDAVKQGRHYVRLGPRRFALITKEMSDRLEALDDIISPGRSGLKLGRAAALHLQSVFPEPDMLSGDAAWLALCRRIAGSRNTAPVVPRELRATLRPYQSEGFAWLSRLSAWDAGACLADDMGLGKTVQALAVLLERANHGPALVVAPTSVGFNWLDEAAKFAPTLRIHLYRGASRSALLASLGAGDVLVTSYDIMTLDIEELEPISFSTLVLDEAQAIKNALTKRARSARRIQAQFRIALSGTPVENHLGELWSLFQTILPGLLGSWDRFRDNFARPIEERREVGRHAALARLIRPFLLRRTKVQVAPDLPPLSEVVESVELSRPEVALYRGAQRACLQQLVASQTGETDGRFAVLASITKLRRLACHPRLFDAESTVASSKLRTALNLLSDLKAHGGRALVFSQFTGHLAILREQLDGQSTPYLYLDGATPAKERARLVRRWAEGHESLFLISLKAGGTGLNLTGADLVVHMDPWWNPAVEDQATDRTHRIGQTKPVTVVRLIAQGTIEEAVVALHASKRELARLLLDGAEMAGKLSTEALVELIRWGESDADDGGTEPESNGATKPPGAPSETCDDLQRAQEAVKALGSLLATEIATHRLSCVQTVQSYGREANRFLAFVQEQVSSGVHQRSLEEWIDAYAEALQSGAFTAPASAGLVWRAVSGRMRQIADAATFPR